MILTPKNWKSFQHYKERTPPWIKLHKGLLDDFEFSRLPAASRALAPMLWLLASEYQDGSINCSMEQMAYRLHLSVNDLVECLSPLIESGFFDASEALAPCKRDAAPETETQVKTEKEGRHSSASPRVNSRFDEFWKEMPKRDGDNPRKPAEKKFNALVKTGVDPDVMIAGARQASADARRRSIYGTKYVPQAIKWLNDQRFLDCAAQAFTDQADELDWDSVCQAFKKIGHWSKHAGNDPSSPNCRCPPEILAKYGLLTQSETVQ